ncbi:M16 family metallopeptidase [Sinimarinibacterium thermocellulolyticum]|uniref:Pitrilysin family protein n=1 Tax=Sinimarinibacterium thermocellulolyticum TaxID=3170016 RepID=A0ABV2A6S3_9GAMM
MMKQWMAAVTAVLAFALVASGVRAADVDAFPDIRISYQRHVLPNGLTLLIHEDRKAPIVAVNVWYHVGSKDERPGRTGFAHLFEHLMFNGSENHNDEFFRPLEAAGATKLNGTTWYDRTNYFQNVPTNALDLALWLESDRMGHLLGAIDQARLDEQRAVVLNEKRQAENRPYGKVWETIARATYPAEHPYSWTTIGSAEDLNAATLDDVKDWFREHYGAANAVLVIAGDVDADAVVEKVMHYFGDIPAGPVRQRHQAWVPRMQGEKRMVLQDRVPQTRIFKVWNVPGFCDPQANILGIAAGVLGDGKNSRLYERLVYRDQIATDVNVGLGPFEIASQFMIDVTVKPGGDAAAVEHAIDEELHRFLQDGPTEEELARVRTKTFAQAIRGLERVDGFGGKSAVLAQYEVYCGTPDRYTEELREVREATPLAVRDIARHWLADGRFTLTVEPFPEYRTADTGADRSKLPAVGAPPDLELPPLQRATLSNGLELVLAERHEAPVVQVSLIADAGYAADAGIKAGTARLTLDMLDEGAGDDDALALSARIERLGAQLSAGSNLDTSFVNLNALKARLAPSLDLFADVLLRPRFAEADLERLRQLLLAAIQQEKAEPYGIASRLYPALIYGAGHAYANPRSGTGTEDSVRAITLDDVKRFYARWLRPDTSTLLVVGDTTLEEIVPLLESRLGAWSAPDEPPPRKQLDHVELPATSRVFLVNRSGAEQSLILATHLAPPLSDPDDLAMQLANAVIGGNFVSRLNMNLREAKGWSYGAFSSISGAKAQRPFIAYAPVQADKTVESMREIRRELEAVRGKAPLQQEEIDFARNSLVRSLPGENETVGDIAGSYTTILVHGLADDYWNDYADRIGGLTPAAVNEAARRLLQPQALTWVVVGDLARIEQPIRALGWGEVSVLDADGARLR